LADSFLVLDESIHTQQPALRFHDRPRPRWGAHHRGRCRALYTLPLNELGALADHRRNLAKRASYDGNGEHMVTYIIDRNINYTNVCNVYCKFCAFYRTEKDDDHYVLTLDQIDQKLDELTAIGGIQILMQAGIIQARPRLVSHPPRAHPGKISAHQHSRLQSAGILPFCRNLRDAGAGGPAKIQEAGLGSVPGGGGEILVDRVRDRIAPLKCKSDQWLGVMREAHALGLNSSATMMFGHVETVDDRIEHLQRLRDTQDETGGFTAFICWTFQPEHTKLHAEPVGSSEYLRMQALSRIYLDNFENVQSSWVTQGPRIGQVALKYGANDFGSVMMEENVVSSAGNQFPPDAGKHRGVDPCRRLRAPPAG